MAGLFPAISPPSALKELHSLITALRQEARHHFKTRVDIPRRMGSAKTPNSHPIGWMMVNTQAVRHRRQSKQSKTGLKSKKTVDRAVITRLKLQSSENIQFDINSNILTNS